MFFFFFDWHIVDYEMEETKRTETRARYCSYFFREDFVFANSV